MKRFMVLPEQLQSFDYYVNKLPIYLQQSHGFVEHYRIWYDMLVGYHQVQTNSSGVVGSASALFNLLDIFQQEENFDGSITNKYLETLIQFEDAGVDELNKYGTTSDILDKLAALFNVKRNFEVTYMKESTYHTRHVRLNNQELLILIKAQIVKNYCDCSYEQLNDYYSSIGLKIVITTSLLDVATSDVYLIKTSSDDIYFSSENVESLFLAGLLTIKSMGINYRHALIDLSNLLTWDSTTVFWDEGDWMI